MAEHGLEPPVLGVAWDGTGYGPDGAIWGGEFLRITPNGWQRAAHLRPFRLPGGEAAMREPRRAALGLLHAAFGADAFAMTDLAPVAAFTSAERATLATMLDRGVNAPLTTSAGRLFDAVAALIGLRQRASYEGQAAMALEWAAAAGTPEPAFRFDVVAGEGNAPLVLDWQPALEAIIADMRAGVAPGIIAAAFHDALARAIADIATRIGEPMVVLSGGCFQNARLTEATVAALERAGLRPVRHEKVPPNDGGLALGPGLVGGKNHGRRVMCLAIPGKILSTEGDDIMRVGRVDFGGVVKQINLAYTPEAAIGDYVLVHVGFAITVIDEAEAEKVFAHLERIGEIEAELAAADAAQ